MPLLSGDADVWVLVPVIEREAGFEVLAAGEYQSVKEPWAFPPGSVVRCEERDVGHGRALVAVEKIA